MATEIERKFLVINDQWRAQAVRSESYQQGYLNTAERCSVRIRIAGEHAFLNIKSATLGIRRLEFEYSIPVADARQMMQQFCRDRSLSKRRYFVPCGRHTWEIDVFEGANAGLVVAEIELGDEQEPFTRPSWLGDEVSDDPRYYNVCLIEKPYSQW